jgi:hypothetical protein
VLEAAAQARSKVINWKAMREPDFPATARAYEGSIDEWRFLVVSYNVGDGPKPERGYDGTITRNKPGVLVIRMPVDFAKQTAALAEKAVAS